MVLNIFYQPMNQNQEIKSNRSQSIRVSFPYFSSRINLGCKKIWLATLGWREISPWDDTAAGYHPYLWQLTIIPHLIDQIWLVGQGHPSEKYEFVNWDDEIPNINGKIKFMATKPPTSQIIEIQFFRRRVKQWIHPWFQKSCSNYVVMRSMISHAISKNPLQIPTASPFNHHKYHHAITILWNPHETFPNYISPRSPSSQFELYNILWKNPNNSQTSLAISKPMQNTVRDHHSPPWNHHQITT